MQISVVIPTCNRKASLLSSLHHLNHSPQAVEEVIVVDSGDDGINSADFSVFKNLNVHHVRTEKSVCIQRNVGITQANSEWILLCDDDVEMPSDYLQKLGSHIEIFPDIGAVSGLWLQKDKNEWKATYPEKSAIGLFWKYIFQLGIWGEIKCSANNLVIRKVKRHYERKGNHISKAGWPVITDFSGEYFTAPVYSLGCCLIKKEWLLKSPFDEVLDRHGIGDNYGVIMGFPGARIRVLNNTRVYHHQEPANRLQKPLQYYRRTLALHYFIKTKARLRGVTTRWLFWSLIGNLIRFIFSERGMIRAAIKSIWTIGTGRNPYSKALKDGRKVVEPAL